MYSLVHFERLFTLSLILSGIKAFTSVFGFCLFPLSWIV